MDDAIARSMSIGKLEQVLARLGGRGRGGTVLFRALLDARGEGFVATESELEDLLFAVLLRFGLPLPSKQVVLGGDLPVGRVDFVYLGRRIVIEADSRKHHSALLDAERDRWRDLELAADGFTVVRVTWRQLIDEPERFIAALKRLLARSA
jgi:very-short-patch-repair endonuclease